MLLCVVIFTWFLWVVSLLFYYKLLSRINMKFSFHNVLLLFIFHFFMRLILLLELWRFHRLWTLGVMLELMLLLPLSFCLLVFVLLGRWHAQVATVVVLTSTNFFLIKGTFEYIMLIVWLYWIFILLMMVMWGSSALSTYCITHTLSHHASTLTLAVVSSKLNAVRSRKLLVWSCMTVSNCTAKHHIIVLHTSVVMCLGLVGCISSPIWLATYITTAGRRVNIKQLLFSVLHMTRARWLYYRYHLMLKRMVKGHWICYNRHILALRNIS